MFIIETMVHMGYLPHFNSQTFCNRDPMNSLYHLTTHSGLEPIVIRELKGLKLEGRQTPHKAPGYVEVEAPDLAPLLELKTIHHVLSVRRYATTDSPWSLMTIRSLAGECLFPEFESDLSGTMRVTCKRIDKTLPFTSETIQLEVAEVILARYPFPVSLKEPKYIVRVDVHKYHLVISLQLTPLSLSKTTPKPYLPVTAMKSNLSYSMLLLGDVPLGGTILDPFLGSGTTLIQASKLSKTYRLIGFDWDEASVEGSILNLNSEGISGADIRCVHALEMSGHLPWHSVDGIITDPPYGIRTAKQKKYFEFYLSFLAQSRRVLKVGGTLTIMVVKRYSFDDALERIRGFKEVERLQVKLGGFTAHLIKLIYVGLNPQEEQKEILESEDISE